jgi:beta-fructofuranosidase
VLAITGTREELMHGGFRVSRYDMGRNFYAASGMRDGAILWGWATESRSREWANEDDWSGMITLPSRIAIADDGRVTSTPVESLESLRSAELPATELPAQFEAEITLSDNARIVLHCGDEHFDIRIADGRVTVDRDNASTDSRAQGGTFSFDDPDVRTLRWFVDGSISELFTDTGYCSTVRFYPTTPPPWRLEISGAEARIWALNG